MKDIIDIVSKYIEEQKNVDMEELGDTKSNIIVKLGSELFREKIRTFDITLGKQATFYRTYMKMFKPLLVFIRRTR